MCTANGGWTGPKAESGTETLGRILGSVDYGLDCVWPADAIATVSWTLPTTNTDGSPLTDLDVIRIVWTDQGDIGNFDCLDPMAGSFNYVDRPGDQTMHTITGLTPGTWEFSAYAVNAIGLCSQASNVASKMITGEVTVSNTVSFDVPNAVGGVVVE